jgi:hypothetical protein
MKSSKVVVILAAASIGGCATDSKESENSQPIVAGAAYTTFVDPSQCLGGSPKGVNCNIYASKDGVYMSGGPTNGSYNLSDGSYYFTVLVPGSQNGGFIDGATGNLSSPHDTAADRTFSITNHTITYAGPHLVGTGLDGKPVVQLMPYDDTTNNGGVYILAICQVGATSASQCKYDAFKVRTGSGSCTGSNCGSGSGSGGEPQFPIVTGEKYYDANGDGQLDNGEVGIAGWQIGFHDGTSDTLTTDADGTFTIELIPDTYTFFEYQGLQTISLQQGGSIPVWWQTGNTVNQTLVTGNATATLNGDKTYTIAVDFDSIVTGVYFGNLCLGKGGGLTLGFWSNKNGQALITSTDLASLTALNLVNANGSNFDPTSKTQYRTWVLSATAVNMAYMLSAQLSAMELNVSHGFVNGGGLIYAPGIVPGSTFLPVGTVMNLANQSLGAHPYTVSGSADRTYQEALKNALDNANNNKTFVQASAATCPAPVFTPPQAI